MIELDNPSRSSEYENENEKTHFNEMKTFDESMENPLLVNNFLALQRDAVSKNKESKFQHTNPEFPELEFTFNERSSS